jgi:fatty acid desaturase
MEENGKLLESLLETASEYGKTSFELAKLKSLDKTSDIVSSLVPHSIVFILIATFLLFLNLGLALWLGDILGKAFYGFFVLAAFYILAGIIFHFFLHDRIKKRVGNYIIKNILK